MNFEQKHLIAFILNKSHLFRKSKVKQWVKAENWQLATLDKYLTKPDIAKFNSYFNDSKQIELELEQLLINDLQMIVYGSDAYPKQLTSIFDPPILLWAKGNIDLLHNAQIAIVGSRNCTNTGRKSASYLSQKLCASGYTITSGLALGIDSASHIGAISVAGKTVAVMGSGFKDPYPQKNIALMQDIIAGDGLIISEYYLEEPPISRNFPERNRIISGLSVAVVIVEASLKSGSLITARTAIEQNRELFAVPSNFLNKNSDGCNQLISQGATIVEDASSITNIVDDIIVRQYAWLNKQKQQINSNSAINTAELSEQQQLVLNSLDYEALSIDELVEITGNSLSDLTIVLSELEVFNLVSKNDIGYFKN